jgi:hypothetical protein
VTPFLRGLPREANGLLRGCRPARAKMVQNAALNIEHPTSNAEHRIKGAGLR